MIDRESCSFAQSDSSGDGHCFIICDFDTENIHECTPDEYCPLEDNENVVYQNLDGKMVPIGTLKRIIKKKSFRPDGMTTHEQIAAGIYVLSRVKEDFQCEVDKYAAETYPEYDNGEISYKRMILIVDEFEVGEKG